MNRQYRIPVQIGTVTVGGDHPIAIQTMTNTPVFDTAASCQQIRSLHQRGADLIRIALPDIDSVHAFHSVMNHTSPIPLIGDIHFDYRIALEAIRIGIPKIRLNPGNIENPDQIQAIARAAMDKGTAIRVGANSGSIPKSLNHLPKAQALAEAAMKEVRLLEKAGFDRIIIAVKSSDIYHTLEATKLVARLCDYPLHVGLTEAGTLSSSLVQSSVVIGSLLMEGLGDTIRYSITGDPIHEVDAAKTLLTSLGLRQGPKVIACPTCGRTCVPVETWANKVDSILKAYNRPVTVAVMGCVVNGVGEGKEADIGIAGTPHGGVVFRKGDIMGSFPNELLWEHFKKMLEEGMDQENDKDW